jgi:c-di-GMP-binding flagellar brake protein YcgR
MTIEKRKTERFDAAVEVMIARNGIEVAGMTINLSLGGAQVRARLDPPPRLGEKVRVALSLPTHGAPISADAEIRWISELERDRIGVQFVTGFRARETWALGQFLDRLRREQV